MRPCPFEYHRAESVDHALDLLARHGDQARLLAGGQSLVAMMNLRLAHADPTAEWSALLLLLDGEVEARAKAGERRIAAEDFFDSAFTTALAPGEMIVGLQFRIPQGAWGGAFVEFAERPGDFAIAAVAATVTWTEGRIGAARIVLSGAETRPVRARAAESLLRGEAVTAELARAAGAAAVEDLDCLKDLRATAAYRRHLFQVLTEDALGTAARRAGAAP